MAVSLDSVMVAPPNTPPSDWDYNFKMCYVDMADLLSWQYRIGGGYWRNIKWWHAPYKWKFKKVMDQGYVLYKIVLLKEQKKLEKQLEFKQAHIEDKKDELAELLAKHRRQIVDACASNSPVTAAARRVMAEEKGLNCRSVLKDFCTTRLLF